MEMERGSKYRRFFKVPSGLVARQRCAAVARRPSNGLYWAAMKTPILNHLALTVPRALVSDTAERRKLVEFYEHVFGWRAIDVMTVDGERLVLHLHQLTHFLFLVGGEQPTVGLAGDHFGIEVYEREALDSIVARAQAFQTDRDSAVEIEGIDTEEYGTIRIHNAYIRYLLPLKVEVQFYEGVETVPSA